MEWELKSTIKTDCDECGGSGRVRDIIDGQYEKCQTCAGKGRVTVSKFKAKHKEVHDAAQDG